MDDLISQHGIIMIDHSLLELHLRASELTGLDRFGTDSCLASSCAPDQYRYLAGAMGEYRADCLPYCPRSM
jgi:hypothetical protein